MESTVTDSTETSSFVNPTTTEATTQGPTTQEPGDDGLSLAVIIGVAVGGAVVLVVVIVAVVCLCKKFRQRRKPATRPPPGIGSLRRPRKESSARSSLEPPHPTPDEPRLDEVQVEVIPEEHEQYDPDQLDSVPEPFQPDSTLDIHPYVNVARSMTYHASTELVHPQPPPLEGDGFSVSSHDMRLAHELVPAPPKAHTLPSTPHTYYNDPKQHVVAGEELGIIETDGSNSTLTRDYENVPKINDYVNVSGVISGPPSIPPKKRDTKVRNGDSGYHSTSAQMHQTELSEAT